MLRPPGNFIPSTLRSCDFTFRVKARWHRQVPWRLRRHTPTHRIAAQLVNIGQHFGYRRIKRAGISSPIRHGGRGSGQRRRLQIGIWCSSPNSLMRAAISSEPMATMTGAPSAFLVAQRHGVMGRLVDDYVGLGHFRHHATTCHFALHPADLRLDFGEPSDSLFSCRTSSLVIFSLLE